MLFARKYNLTKTDIINNIGTSPQIVLNSFAILVLATLSQCGRKVTGGSSDNFSQE
jgi:hypothetical protein